MRRIGLVLGGGGIVGVAYHAAVLSAIADETGWDPRDAEVVIGTSAGSVSASELRAGISPADMAARRAGTEFSAEAIDLLVSLGPPPQVFPTYLEVDKNRARLAFHRLLLQATMFPGSVPPGVIAALAAPPGRLSPEWIESQADWLNAEWPGRPLVLCAVDLDTGRRVAFGSPGAPFARVGQAVAASCAIPGVFAPVAIGDRLFVDGGGWSPTNADLLADHKLDLALVVSPMTAGEDAMLGAGDRWIRAGCRLILNAELGRVRRAGIPYVVVEPSREDMDTMGSLKGTDVLDESRCEAVVHQVRDSVRGRIRGGSFPGLDLLSSSRSCLNLVA